jgi:hypothetical protein
LAKAEGGRRDQIQAQVLRLRADGFNIAAGSRSYGVYNSLIQEHHPIDNVQDRRAVQDYLGSIIWLKLKSDIEYERRFCVSGQTGFSPPTSPSPLKGEGKNETCFNKLPSSLRTPLKLRPTRKLRRITLQLIAYGRRAASRTNRF